MQIPEADWRCLSHRERRSLIGKERRRRKRRAAALKREEELAALECQPGYLERVAKEEREREEVLLREEAQRRLEHEAWQERERVAQETFRKQHEKEEQALREKEERERLIREEWEALQKREKESEEQRQKVRREKEDRLKVALSTEDRPSTQKPTHNPLAPDGYTAPDTKNFGTERDSQNCPFFLKTGACRFGDSCSRLHPHPPSSTTLLIPGMYSSLGLSEGTVDDRDDASLEYEEGDMYEHFRSFYDDVYPEFATAGKVTQFKVSCNYEPHLRGNVYVQYASEEECSAACRMFNGRWYAQRQLSCQFCPVRKWRNAICGLYSQNRCPKGKHCNFLHVFRNPGGAFSRADRDLPALIPSPSRRGSRHDRRRSSKSRSRSRERYQRGRLWDRSRERWGRSRSRSRERRRVRSRSGERRRERSRERSSTRRHSSSSRHRRHRSRSSNRREGERERIRSRRSRTRSRSRDKKSVETGESSEKRGEEGEENGKSERKKKKKRGKSEGPPLSHSSSTSKHRHKKHKKHKHRHRGEGDSKNSRAVLEGDAEVERESVDEGMEGHKQEENPEENGQLEESRGDEEGKEAGETQNDKTLGTNSCIKPPLNVAGELNVTELSPSNKHTTSPLPNSPATTPVSHAFTL